MREKVRERYAEREREKERDEEEEGEREIGRERKREEKKGGGGVMGERGQGEGDLLTSKTHLHQTPKPLSYCKNTD